MKICYLELRNSENVESWKGGKGIRLEGIFPAFHISTLYLELRNSGKKQSRESDLIS
jgi:hypothetical protein